MSPVSRPRNRKSKNKRRSPSPADAQTLDGLLAKAVRSWQPLVTATDPLEVEIFGSEFLDILRDPGPVGDFEPEPGLVFDVLDYAARKASPAAVALARCLAAVATTDEQRTLAHEVAEALVVAGGLPDPTWAGVIGFPIPGRCWTMADAYGDVSNIALEFSYGDDRHLLMSWIDFNLVGGWAKDIFVTWEPGETLSTLRSAAADSNGLLTVGDADPVDAVVLIKKGIAATDALPSAEVDGTLPSYRALALARCRLFPETAGVGPHEGFIDVPDDERSRIVAEFLSSEGAADLPAAAERCARLIVDYGCDYDHGKPMRVSPTKLATFLHGWLPHEIVLDDEQRAAVPAVTSAWARWAAARTALPPTAAGELEGAVDEILREFKAVDLGHRAPGTTYRIKVGIRGAKPPIWRRLALPSNTTLDRLHDVIQVAFGWEHAHLHSFHAAGERYEPAGPVKVPGLGDESGDESAVRLDEVAPHVKDKIGYEYDFGDSWVHEIVVERIEPYGGTPHAVCLGGRRAGPPEDCGGVPGYAFLCAALEDPHSPDHAERLEWLREAHGDFDPAVFDKKTINHRLAEITLAP